MKNLIMSLSILMSIFLMSNSQTDNTDWDNKKVESFVRKTANSSLMEVQVSQLVLQKASSQQVKDFAYMMVQDHSVINLKLQSAVKNSKIDIPTTLDSEFQNKIDKVNKETGNEFDKSYMDLMVNDHKENIKNLEEASTKVTDPDLKNWIENTLSELKSHLDNAERIRMQFN